MQMKVPVRPTPALDKNHSDNVQNVGFVLIIPAVYQYRSPAGLVLGDDPLVEGQHGGGIVWDSMVRPGRVVKLLHLQLAGLLRSMLQLKHRL